MGGEELGGGTWRRNVDPNSCAGAFSISYSLIIVLCFPIFLFMISIFLLHFPYFIPTAPPPCRPYRRRRRAWPYDPPRLAPEVFTTLGVNGALALQFQRKFRPQMVGTSSVNLPASTRNGGSLARGHARR